MTDAVTFAWHLPINVHVPPAEDAIRGTFSASIPPAVATREDADIPGIIAHAVARFQEFPEVVRYHQETAKACDLECRMKECGEQVAELTKRRSEGRDVDEMLELTDALRSRQAAFDTLKENAALIAVALPKLAEAARRTVTSQSDDELAGRRRDLARAAHEANVNADRLLSAASAEIAALAASPSVLSAIEAHVDARRAAAASRLLNASTAPILNEILTGVGVTAG